MKPSAVVVPAAVFVALGVAMVALGVAGVPLPGTEGSGSTRIVSLLFGLLVSGVGVVWYLSPPVETGATDAR